MSRDLKKENQGKKSWSHFLGPLINQRKAIMDCPQEVEDKDLEEEDLEVGDTPNAIKTKKRRNPLTSQSQML